MGILGNTLSNIQSIKIILEVHCIHTNQVQNAFEVILMQHQHVQNEKSQTNNRNRERDEREIEKEKGGKKTRAKNRTLSSLI